MWTRFFSQIVHAVHEAFAVHRVQYIMAISIISDVLGSHGLEGSREFWQKAYHGTQDICYSLYGTHIARAEDSSLIHTKKPFSWVCWGKAWYYTFMPSHMKQKRPHTFLSVYQDNMQAAANDIIFFYEQWKNLRKSNTRVEHELFLAFGYLWQLWCLLKRPNQLLTILHTCF